MPVLAVVILFSTIFTLSDFNIVYVLTRGGPMNMTHLFATYSFALGLQGGEIGQGAAVSLFLFPILLAVVFVQLRLVRRAALYEYEQSRARWARNIRPLFTVYLPVLPYVLFALFPLYFMLVTSLKSNAELYDVNAMPFWISRGLTADHYELLSTDTPFWSWFANSLIVSLAATVISVALGVLAAYPLARLRFAGADSFGVAIFITYLVPPTLLFLPLSAW